MSYARIRGTGSYLPERVVTNSALAEIMDTSFALQALTAEHLVRARDPTRLVNTEHLGSRRRGMLSTLPSSTRSATPSRFGRYGRLLVLLV